MLLTLSFQSCTIVANSIFPRLGHANVVQLWFDTQPRVGTKVLQINVSEILILEEENGESRQQTNTDSRGRGRGVQSIFPFRSVQYSEEVSSRKRFLLSPAAPLLRVRKKLVSIRPVNVRTVQTASVLVFRAKPSYSWR